MCLFWPEGFGHRDYAICLHVPCRPKSVAVTRVSRHPGCSTKGSKGCRKKSESTCSSLLLAWSKWVYSEVSANKLLHVYNGNARKQHGPPWGSLVPERKIACGEWVKWVGNLGPLVSSWTCLLRCMLSRTSLSTSGVVWVRCTGTCSSACQERQQNFV